MPESDSRKNGMGSSSEPVPRDDKVLAAWFNQAVSAEIEQLEKASKSQNYELLGGKQRDRPREDQAIYEFVVADGTRIPEDADGRLKALDREFRASILSQQANRVQILIEGTPPLPAGIFNATLVLDDTALLRRLADALAESSKSDAQNGMASLLFHPDEQRSGRRDLSGLRLPPVEPETSLVLEQACGSPLTFIWGPPGTGKTFTIARLLTALVEMNERVLLTSHTNAAIDQVLYEAVSPDARGPLAEHRAVDEGRVLRLGRTIDPKVPPSVRFDAVLERRGEGLQEKIRELETEISRRTEELKQLDDDLYKWRLVAEALERHEREKLEVVRHADQVERARGDVSRQQEILQSAYDALTSAQRAWFAKERKATAANSRIENATRWLGELEARLNAASHELQKQRDRLAYVERSLEELKASCANLRPQSALNLARQDLQAKVDVAQSGLRELEAELLALSARLIADAQVVCCTLTKNYTARELASKQFDAVLVDEVSMALPPLLFLAGKRATSRVVLVGDFLQLPPVVRSDNEVSDSRLRRDVFELAGLTDGIRPKPDCGVMTHLVTQRRMAPAIADVARHLAYGPDGIRDHASVTRRQAKEWLNLLPESAIVVVDTADLNCWSGKQPGSLSRFNFYSGSLAVELGAMCASRIPQPAAGEPVPIGIVTPFAAQRRLLVRLIEDLGLESWILAGTVHTFQGNEAPLIIFDCVLDNPYWSARLSNPNDMRQVVRELKVAVTRARSKFVFIGSSEWLNQHTKPTSGLGRLWNFLKDRADLVSATELVEGGFAGCVAASMMDRSGWRIPHRLGEPVHEILDEETFFPRFARDLEGATKSVFGLVPFFGEYRWPLMQPLFASALARRVEVTLVVPPSEEAGNSQYVEAAVRHLRSMGAVVVYGSGLHGKDIVVDERVHYTGSLNWASHRGRSEIMHRTESPTFAKLVLQYLQARFIRAAGVHEDGEARHCPICGGPTRVVNQRRQQRSWDKQAMKVGCANPECQRYLRDVDERPPFRTNPICNKDGRTKRRRVRRGRGEVWECPKHPRECGREKVVPGDPK